MNWTKSIIAALLGLVCCGILVYLGHKPQTGALIWGLGVLSGCLLWAVKLVAESYNKVHPQIKQAMPNPLNIEVAGAHISISNKRPKEQPTKDAVALLNRLSFYNVVSTKEEFLDIASKIAVEWDSRPLQQPSLQSANKPEGKKEG